MQARVQDSYASARTSDLSHIARPAIGQTCVSPTAPPLLAGDWCKDAKARREARKV